MEQILKSMFEMGYYSKEQYERELRIAQFDKNLIKVLGELDLSKYHD